MNYIDLDFETALELKFENGRQKHRKDSSANFNGDPCEELFQELLDALHYILILEGQGVELPGYKTTIKNMALALQTRRQELKRRI